MLVWRESYRGVLGGLVVGGAGCLDNDRKTQVRHDIERLGGLVRKKGSCAHHIPPMLSLSSYATIVHKPDFTCGVSASTLSVPKPVAPPPMIQMRFLVSPGGVSEWIHSMIVSFHVR